MDNTSLFVAEATSNVIYIFLRFCGEAIFLLLNFLSPN